MPKKDPYRLGEEFTQKLTEFQRPLFLLAHHDDEIPTAGLLQRLAPRLNVVWVTNSDGLYFESDLTPPEYAEVRKAEGIRSVGIGGVDESRTRCLDFSEVEIYRLLSRLHSGDAKIEEARPFFDKIRTAVHETVFDLRPDAVFTLAWQGGQPEHDLTHFFTMLALRDLEHETGQKAAFFHCPAYEYTILVAMRFHPMYRGRRIRLRLDDSELATKMEMVQAYPSQVRLFDDFRKVFKWVAGPIGLLTGGARNMEDFLAVEEFGPVPEGLDYAARPHIIDRCTYMFDDFEGVPVTFRRSVRPIVKAFVQARTTS
ncbi:MAG: hypothetical protein GXP54_01895 [Deltaproteobacteria bacterium]|nr:hypothetical protein [Deltaproteobacteria bacterium]